jgi:NTP pyrophosphatase (non-canonical NTP hydrolase)
MHIREFQEMMKCLYFHRDAKRGVERTYDWLNDELKELGDALKTNHREEIKNEFADVIAWLASLANIMEIDLEKATIKKYNGKCPKCKKAPCQ